MSKTKEGESIKILIRSFRSLLWIAIFSILITTFYPSLSYAATLDELEQQKQIAQDKANALKQQAAQKQSSINTIQDLVDKLTSDIASYQKQINTTQKNITTNEKSIAATELEIQQKQAELEVNMAKQAEALQTMYVLGQKSTLENFLSSDSFSEATARQQYLTALSDKIESMMRTIKQLKKDLETKRDSLKQHRLELGIQKEQLVAYQATIVAQKNQQNTLLNGAQAEKQQILADAKIANQQVENISARIYAERQKLISSGDETVTSGSDGGYPFKAIGAADPWGFYTRQCTSYAAWYWNSVLGRKWYRLAGYGDAWGWPNAAASNGVSTHGHDPQVNAIISWGRSSTAPYGHVAIVRKVNDDGTIDVSEYNYIARDIYSYRSNVNPGAYGSYTYIY